MIGEKENHLRTFKEAAFIVSIIRKFKFFTKYDSVLTPEEWLCLGLSARLTPFEEYEPLCQNRQRARIVYLILNGEVAVTLQRAKKFEAKMFEGEGKILAVLKRGVSFGEIAVLYKNDR